MMIEFSVDGQPKPKQRPVFNSRTRSARTPESTKEWEALVGWSCRAAMGVLEPLEGNLAVTLVFRRRGKRRADFDNLCKAVLDAINGIAYVDDGQIVAAVVMVTYGNEFPGVDIVVREGFTPNWPPGYFEAIAGCMADDLIECDDGK